MIKSNRDKSVVRASAESEAHSMSNATSRGAYEIGKSQQRFKETDQYRLYKDNQATMHMANNGRSYSDKTRHIKIHHHFVKQYLDSGEFTLTRCPT